MVSYRSKLTLSSDLRLPVPNCITSSRKLKPEVTGHWTPVPAVLLAYFGQIEQMTNL